MPGFIPFATATFMLDLVVLAMIVVLPVLAYSILLVKRKRDYATHRRVQLGLGLVLFVAVLAFATEMRVFGWRHLAADSPYFETILPSVLLVHRTLSISTSVLWIITLVTAWRMFPNPAKPNRFSPRHKVLAWLATGGMFATAFTGWFFYYLAFVAK